MGVLPGIGSAIPSNRKSFALVGSVPFYVYGSSGTVDISGIPKIAGDLGILFDYVRSPSAAPSATTPSGHTNVINGTGGFARGMISYKILDGTETTITGITGPSGTYNNKIYAIFRYKRAVTGVTAVGFQSEITNGDPVGQTISSGSTSSYPTLCLAQMANAFVDMVGMNTSPFMNPLANNAAATIKQWSYYKHYEDSAVNHTVNFGDVGNENCLQSGYLRISL